MNPLSLRLLLGVGSAVAALAVTPPVFADTTSFARFSGGNICSTPFGDSTCYAPLRSQTGVGNSTADTGSIVQPFSGLASTGVAGSGWIAGRAWAAVNGTSLSSSAIAEFKNPLINSNNLNLVQGGYYSPPTINLSGIPTAVNSNAVAYLSDSVAVTGETAPWVRLTLTLTGSIAADPYPVWSNASVFQNAGLSAFSGGSTLFYVANEGNFSVTLITNPIPTINNAFTFGLGLYTEVDINLQYSPSSEFGQLAGTSSFGNTLTIDNVLGFDTNGIQVRLDSATGQTGLIYSISPVPEPMSSALLVAGLAIIVARQRFRHIHRDLGSQRLTSAA